METCIFIHNSEDMSVKHHIDNVPPNPHGIAALSPVDGKPWLAYPVSGDRGEVQLFDFDLLRNGSVVQAHQNTIAAVNFNSDCSMIASASKFGEFSVKLYSVKIETFLCFSYFVMLFF